MQVVYDTLRELKVEDKKIVTLLNKQDKLLAPMVVKDFRADASLAVSAKQDRDSKTSKIYSPRG